MRRWFVALCLAGFSSGSLAADYELPTLRGSSPFIPAAPKYMRWGGFYIGGQVGAGNANMDFAGATESLIAYLLRTTALENESRPSEWGVLGSSNRSGGFVGGFVGYNSQWDDVILGVDFNYNRGNFRSNAPVTPITRVVAAGGNTYLLNITGDASMRIRETGSARLRAGWVVDNFLPYATLGAAIGRADVARSAQVDGVENPPAGYPIVPCSSFSTPPCSEFAFATSDSKKGAFIYGWSAGGGLDLLVMPNVFVRAEYEYLWFTDIQGIKAELHTARLGAAIKF